MTGPLVALAVVALVAAPPLVLTVHARHSARQHREAVEYAAHVEALRDLNQARRNGEWVNHVRRVRTGWPDSDGTVR